ncbi:MAG: BamA/TamA family outer membrane protein [Sulfurihydrogenibium sp.]|nr:BamA/TamA family outer membrane protein [Sulfurihydrogenibium sp.]
MKVKIKFLFILLFICFAKAEERIISNYPLPKNNGEEILRITNDLNYVANLFELTNDFEKIEIKEDKIFLTRKPFLKSIEIKGNKSFWKDEIVGITGLRVNSALDSESLKTIPLRIRQFYAEKGYLFANASISTKFDENGNAFVRLNIDEGKKVKLNDVIFLSDQKISEEDKNQLLKVLNLKKGDIIYFDELQESIEKLNEYLKNNGYFESFIVLQDIEQVDNNFANIYILIDLGSRYFINFTGNNSFDNKQLMNLLTFKKNGFNYNELDLSKENLMNFYKSNGFLDVDIITRVEEQEENQGQAERPFIKINFIINEGKRYKVDKIFIDTDYEEIKSEISKFEGNFYDKNKLLSYLQEQERKLYENGYISASYKVEEIKDENRFTLKVEFKKGKKYILKEIKQKNYSVKKDFKLPKIYDPQELLNLQDEFREKAREDGYLDAEVLLQTDLIENNDRIDVIATYDYNLGQRYRNGLTFVYGSFHLSPRTILKQFPNKEYFEKENFDVSIIRLYESRLFDYVNPLLLPQEERKTVDKAIFVHDDKRGLVQGNVGYSTDQQFKASVAVILRNLFNYGYEFSTYIERSNFQTNYRLSLGNRLFKWNLSGFASTFLFNQYHRNYDLKSSGYDLFFEKRNNKWVKSSFRLERKYNVITNEGIFTPLKNYKVITTSFGLTDDHRNNKINPSSGYYSILNFKTTFGDINYQSLEGSFRYYKEFLDFFIFSQRFSTGYSFKSINVLPLAERYFLGGIANMRGFGFEELSGKQKIGGNSYLLINNDLRFPIYQKYNLYFLTFLDLGNVYTKSNEYRNPYFRKTAGIGIYVPTPAGSLIFDYAKKLDAKPNENKHRIEFSIGLDF